MPDITRFMPGTPFPDIKLPLADGQQIALGSPGWRAIFVIRGAHCGICRQYLEQIESYRADWEAKGVHVVVASADDSVKADAFAKEAGYLGTVVGGLDVASMAKLGLWMTGPENSPLDYVHAEPGFFLVDPEGNLAVIDVSTLATIRPDLKWLSMGVNFITDGSVRPANLGSYEATS